MNPITIPADAHRMTEMVLTEKKTGRVLSRFYPLDSTDAEFNKQYAEGVIAPHIENVMRVYGLTEEDMELRVVQMKITSMSDASSA